MRFVELLLIVCAFGCAGLVLRRWAVVVASAVFWPVVSLAVATGAAGESRLGLVVAHTLTATAAAAAGVYAGRRLWGPVGG